MPANFRPGRGIRMPFEEVMEGDGWHVDWNGAGVFAAAMEAGRRAVDFCDEAAAETAREEHLWENRTFQTEDSVYWRRAHVHLDPAMPHVTGEWGVEDRPRFKAETDENGDMLLDRSGKPVLSDTEADVSTKDVALFLEFGTVKMEARPWLYPAHDFWKEQLIYKWKQYYAEVSSSGAPYLRDSLGRFARAVGI